ADSSARASQFDSSGSQGLDKGWLVAGHHDCQAVIHLFAQPLTKPCDTFDVKAGLGLIQDEEFAGAHEGR
ncbi:hypothetical protein ACTFE8_00565, partial [Campylobacter jejuni]